MSRVTQSVNLTAIDFNWWTCPLLTQGGQACWRSVFCGPNQPHGHNDESGRESLPDCILVRSFQQPRAQLRCQNHNRCVYYGGYAYIDRSKDRHLDAEIGMTRCEPNKCRNNGNEK